MMSGKNRGRSLSMAVPVLSRAEIHLSHSVALACITGDLGRRATGLLLGERASAA
jgi:hypothetical protein